MIVMENMFSLYKSGIGAMALAWGEPEDRTVSQTLERPNVSVGACSMPSSKIHSRTDAVHGQSIGGLAGQEPIRAYGGENLACICS